MKVRLLNSPSFKTYPGARKNVELVQPLIVSIDGRILRVPKGFRFDGASAPRPVRWIFDSDDGGYRSPAVHDYLYRFQGKVQGFALSRRRVDRVFLLCMKDAGVPRWKRWAAYVAVRVGGLAAWLD